MDKLSPFYFPYANDNFEEWAPRTMLGVMGVIPQVVKQDIIYSNIKLNSKHITIVGGVTIYLRNVLNYELHGIL